MRKGDGPLYHTVKLNTSAFSVNTQQQQIYVCFKRMLLLTFLTHIDWTRGLNKYWLSPPKNRCPLRQKLRVTVIFEGCQFPVLYSSALYWMLIEYIVFVTLGFKTIHVKNDYGELYTHKFWAVNVFGIISPLVEQYRPLSTSFMRKGMV